MTLLNEARTFLQRLRAFVAVVAAGASTASPSPSPAQSDPVTDAWNAARSVDRIESYERFIETYPDSSYVDEAFRALVTKARGGGLTRGLSVEMY